MQVQTSVRPTPNPNFLRVDAKVFKKSEAQFQITTVMGRN
jgi:general secretion pathway protein I